VSGRWGEETLDRGLKLALTHLHQKRTSMRTGPEDYFDLETALAAVEEVRDLMQILGEGDRPLRVTHAPSKP
jgi:hypothetical protein